MKSNVNKEIMRYFYLILILFTITSASFGQKIKIKAEKDKLGTFKEKWTFWNHIRKGKSAYKDKTFISYIEAADHFRNAYEMIPENSALNYWLGMSYLNSKPKNWAERYIEKAYNTDKTIHPKLIYNLSKAKHLNYKFDESITLMNEFKSTLTAEELGYMDEEIKKHLSECRYAKEYIEDTARVFITRIDEINTKYDDFAPVIPPDGKKMYFTSKQPTKKKEIIYKATGQNVENIFWAGKHQGEWNLNGNISKKLNTKENNAVVGLSPNGMQLLLFDGKTNGGDIYKTEYKNTKWKAPKDSEFGKINSKDRESSATIAYDNRTMYFISDRDDDKKIGGQDIYISTRAKSNKKWNKPVNAGGTLNSKYDEEGLFLHPSGQVIYFSSKGHTSMGGYDLFKSELQEDGSWGTPENLGYPINTPGDDLFFGITANGRYGYYSSRGKNGEDFDIFEIIFLGPEKPLIQSSEDMLIASIAEPITETVIEKSVEIKTIRLTIVKGKIYDAITNDPITAIIEISDNDADSVIMTSETGEGGEYLVSLPSGKNYAMTIKAKDYLFHSENFNIPPATNYKEVIKDIAMNKLAAGTKVILNNIFFEYGKTVLRTTSYPELNRVVKLLEAYPKLKIEISGHTDNKGSLAVNKRISENRAKAVVDYLLGKEIDVSRLTYKGYAYLQPVATNDTEEGRQRNRRVEFKIISAK
jgi:outer membrane protein OmpA-like peptidoglycan-associated protein